MLIYSADEPKEIAPLLYTKRQAARVLSICERTLQGMSAPNGPIPCIRLPGRVMYAKQSLLEWIAKTETRQVTTPDGFQNSQLSPMKGLENDCKDAVSSQSPA